MRAILMSFLLLTVWLEPTVGQTLSQPTKDEKKRLATEQPKLEQAAGQFNPAFFNDPKNQHQVVVVSVTNGVYSPIRRAVRPGKFPFPQEMSLPFTIAFIGPNNKQLGGYSIDTPATVRSCESQRVGPRSPTGTFTFEVLLPNDPAILRLDLSDQGKRIATLDIPRETKPPGYKPK